MSIACLEAMHRAGTLPACELLSIAHACAGQASASVYRKRAAVAKAVKLRPCSQVLPCLALQIPMRPNASQCVLALLIT